MLAFAFLFFKNNVEMEIEMIKLKNWWCRFFGEKGKKEKL